MYGNILLNVLLIYYNITQDKPLLKLKLIPINKYSKK